MVTYHAKTGDVGHVFRDTLLADEPPNLTGATVRFVMKPISIGVAKIAAAATITNTTAPATVAYTCTADDLNTPGRFLAEWEVTYSNGTKQTFPNDGHILVIVTDDLD